MIRSHLKSYAILIVCMGGNQVLPDGRIEPLGQSKLNLFLWHYCCQKCVSLQEHGMLYHCVLVLWGLARSS